MYNYDKNLVPRARELRSNATKQENHLWYDFLRAYPIRCHRQKIMGEYIVDFYCPQAKLVIELDGQHHLEKNQAEYDEERTKYIRAGGYRVIRFSNNMIDTQFASVCEKIDKEIKYRLNEKALLAREGGGAQRRGEPKGETP